MPANRRIHFGVQAVGIAPCGTNTFTAAHGVQSIGLATRLNLEQIFEIGQLALYAQPEGLPEVEATAEKVLDGYPLLYHLCTYGAADATLVGRSNQRATLALSIFSDLQNSASGTPIKQCVCSGLYINSVTYDFKTDGPFTESVTLVGNNKTWLSSGFTFTGGFSNDDDPLAAEGVNRRQHFKMSACRFPTVIPGINGSNVNAVDGAGDYAVHIQSVRTSVNLNRDQLIELGRKSPYFRFIQFPVEVRTDVEVLSTSGDLVSVLEESESNSGAGEKLYIETVEGTKIDLGLKNKLSNVNYGGANAGARGGQATVTYSFTTFNDFKVVHPQDPTAALAG